MDQPSGVPTILHLLSCEKGQWPCSGTWPWLCRKRESLLFRQTEVDLPAFCSDQMQAQGAEGGCRFIPGHLAVGAG